MSEDLRGSLERRLEARERRALELEGKIDTTTEELRAAQERGRAAGIENLQQKIQRHAGVDERIKETFDKAPVPEELTKIPKPENVQLRPFGTVKKDAPIFDQLSQTFGMLGLLAQMGVGVGKGFALGAQAAYAGALDGWAKGDQQRAENEWKNYHQQLEYARADNEQKMHTFNQRMQQFGHDKERFRLEMLSVAVKDGWGDDAVNLILKDVTAVGDQLTAYQKALERNETHLERLDTHLINESKEERARAEYVRNPARGMEWYDTKTGKPYTPTKGEAQQEIGRYQERAITEGDPRLRRGGKDTTEKDASQALNRNRSQARQNVVANLRHVPKEIWGGFTQAEQKAIMEYYTGEELKRLAADDPLLEDRTLKTAPRSKIVDTFEGKVEASGNRLPEWLSSRLPSWVPGSTAGRPAGRGDEGGRSPDTPGSRQTLSRSDPDYRTLRSQGMTDEQIELRYGVTIK